MGLDNIFKKGTSGQISSEVSEAIEPKNTKKDWYQRGVDAAGLATGNSDVYGANLNSAVEEIKKFQKQDLATQEDYKRTLEHKKQDYETGIETRKNELKDAEEEAERLETKLQQLRKKKGELETDGKTNKNALVNFVFGTFILVGITIYLFLFYSSTAYSAFFKDFGLGNTTVTEAMFDPEALSNAWNEGFTELFFILLIPTLFLGLGYVIHQFGSNGNNKQDTKINTIKIFALYALTFVFDCLLAYKISKALYDVEALSSLTPMQAYSFSLAAGNVDFWTVIFCGFVAYVIWGLVFSFSMNSYGSLHKHTAEIKSVEIEIGDLSSAVSNAKGKVTKIKNEIEKLKGEIAKLQQSMAGAFIVNWTEIKDALAAFHKGWLGYMSLANKTKDEIQKTSDIYEKFIKQIDSNNGKE